MKSSNIIYLVSKYPTVTETFIAREIKEIEKLGDSVIICEIRLSNPFLGNQYNNIEPIPANIYRMGFNLNELLEDIRYSFVNSRKELFDCMRDLLSGSIKKPTKFINLVYIFLVAIRYNRIIKSLRINFIRAHFLHTEAITAYWLSKLSHVPYSVTAHVVDIYYDPQFIRKVVDNAAFTVAITQQMRNHLENLGSKNIFIIRNGVSLSEFLINDEIKKDNPPLILAIGSLVECKGFEFLIESCHLLKSNGSDFKCVIIGEGSERQKLKKQIHRLSLVDKVTLLGARNFAEVKSYLKHATILVVPSIPTKNASDGLPTVIIEAMALDVPVIASNYAGIPDIVIDGVTGVLVAPGDANSLYVCIKDLLLDQNCQRELAQNGRECVEKKYNIETNVAELRRLIDLYGIVQPNQ